MQLISYKRRAVGLFWPFMGGRRACIVCGSLGMPQIHGQHDALLVHVVPPAASLLGSLHTPAHYEITDL